MDGLLSSIFDEGEIMNRKNQWSFHFPYFDFFLISFRHAIKLYPTYLNRNSS